MGRSRDDVLERVAAVRARIAEVCAGAGRDPAGVTLVAAAKTVEPDAIAWVVEAGVRDVGENYARELRDKRDAVPGARWHYIGTLQSSNAHHVARLADVVQALVPGRAAERLGRRASEAGRTLDGFLEVDLAGGRTGVGPADVPDACDALARIEGLAVRGLMTIAPIGRDPEDARAAFRRLRELRDGVLERHPGARELSMGMSGDYEVALEEGATMVRLGTALFGARPAR